MLLGRFSFNSVEGFEPLRSSSPHNHETGVFWQFLTHRFENWCSRSTYIGRFSLIWGIVLYKSSHSALFCRISPHRCGKNCQTAPLVWFCIRTAGVRARPCPGIAGRGGVLAALDPPNLAAGCTIYATNSFPVLRSHPFDLRAVNFVKLFVDYS